MSLNALELFTRDLGLDKCIKDLAQDCIMKQKATRSIALNDTIVSELMDVKKMLELKSRQVEQKEKELKAKEQQLEQQKKAMLQQLKDEAQVLAKEGEARIAKAFSEVQKKVQAAERNIQNKLKLF